MRHYRKTILNPLIIKHIPTCTQCVYVKYKVSEGAITPIRSFVISLLLLYFVLSLLSLLRHFFLWQYAPPSGKKCKVKKDKVSVLSPLIILHLFWHIITLLSHLSLNLKKKKKPLITVRRLLRASYHLFQNISSLWKNIYKKKRWYLIISTSRSQDEVQVWNSLIRADHICSCFNRSWELGGTSLFCLLNQSSNNNRIQFNQIKQQYIYYILCYMKHFTHCKKRVKRVLIQYFTKSFILCSVRSKSVFLSGQQKYNIWFCVCLTTSSQITKNSLLMRVRFSAGDTLSEAQK